MSVAIPIEELPAALARYSWCYVLTVGDGERAHLSAVHPTFADGAFTVDVGRSTIANAAARPQVVLLFPPVDHAGMSLIVDCDATAEGEPLRVIPTKATLHRAAITSA